MSMVMVNRIHCTRIHSIDRSVHTKTLTRQANDLEVAASVEGGNKKRKENNKESICASVQLPLLFCSIMQRQKEAWSQVTNSPTGAATLN